jgi:hypothetical protein
MPLSIKLDFFNYFILPVFIFTWKEYLQALSVFSDMAVSKRKMCGGTFFHF